MIRDYEPSKDYEQLRDCFVALQDHERQTDPRMPSGNPIADEYLERLFERCEKWDGVIFVAELEAQVVGYVGVWARLRSDEPDDDPSIYALISDLSVMPDYRGRGLGRLLLSRAEAYVRARGVNRIKIRVLAENRVARRLYESAGFSAYEVEMQKLFSEGGSPNEESNP